MTDEVLLTLALHGGEEQWQELHKLCLERPTAEQLARALERGANQQIDQAVAWAGVLEDLHPGLKVALPP